MTSPLVIMLLLMLALAAHCWRLHRHARQHGWLHSQGPGWWTVDLRRRACVCSVPGDLQPYPQPREFRIRVWNLAGVPLWSQACFVSLPVHCDALVGQLDGHSFDHLFSGAYRLRSAPAANGPGARAAHPA